MDSLWVYWISFWIALRRLIAALEGGLGLRV
jgi:hypothetical protein